jgi:hypothetical protein
MNFTLGNHLRYAIEGREYGFRETPFDRFNVSVGQVDVDHYRTSNWLDEQYRTADSVYKEFGKDLIVMFSGGTDSEIVIRSFLAIGVTPRCVFIRFKGGYNEGDYLSAIAVTNALDLPLEVFDIDVIDYYRSGQAAEFAQSIQCRQMAYLTVYKVALELQAPTVMGGEMFLRRHVTVDNSKWYYCFRENEDASAMRFSLKYNLPLVNEWFSYTPEMLGYYLEDPQVHRLINERFNYKLSSVSSKNEILKRLMPGLLEKEKTHGYENLMGFNRETYQTLYLTHPRRLEPSLDGIFVDDLYTQLFGKEYASS